MTPSPTQSQIQAALKAFLIAVLPDGTGIVAGQNNRVPIPPSGNYVVYTPINRNRFSTNLDSAVDCKFTASISGVILTVTQVQIGALAAGAIVSGAGVTPAAINMQISGAPGGSGTYQLAGAGQTVGSTAMASGQKTVAQDTEVIFQIDFHSPTLLDASDMAQTVSTLFRDEFATTFFASLDAPLNLVVPLHADDPKQIPFINDSNQYETRWVLDAHLEVAQAVTVQEQFADSTTLKIIDVDAAYPP